MDNNGFEMGNEGDQLKDSDGVYGLKIFGDEI